MGNQTMNELYKDYGKNDRKKTTLREESAEMFWFLVAAVIATGAATVLLNQPRGSLVDILIQMMAATAAIALPVFIIGSVACGIEKFNKYKRVQIYLFIALVLGFIVISGTLYRM